TTQMLRYEWGRIGIDTVYRGRQVMAPEPRQVSRTEQVPAIMVPARQRRSLRTVSECRIDQCLEIDTRAAPIPRHQRDSGRQVAARTFADDRQPPGVPPQVGRMVAQPTRRRIAVLDEPGKLDSRT